MLKFIGLTGLAGAGKDTFALALQRALISKGIKTHIASWAAPIRSIAAALGFRPFDREVKEDPVPFVHEVFLGRLMDQIDIFFGGVLDEHRRAELYAFTADALEKYKRDDMLFISPRQFMQLFGTEAGRKLSPDLWVKTVEQQYIGVDGVVLIPDTRFANEVRACDLVVNVMRPGVLPVSKHVSEELANDLADGGCSTAHGVELINVLNDRGIHELDDMAFSIAAYVADRRDMT